ncbi:hypothetical protein BGZ94_000916 [Podila epigama]|nr:hypothetical protein BGZ94_000916 [Podila epigama]
MPILPFSHIVRNPAKDVIVLSFGEHLQTVDTKSGVILSSSIPLEERESNGLTVQPLNNIPNAEQENKTRISVMTCSKDGAYVATAADDKIMKIWDTESWNCLGTRHVFDLHALHYYTVKRCDRELILGANFTLHV